MENRPVAERLDPRTLRSITAYDRGARAYQEALRRRRPLADVRRFAGFVGEGARVLDLGCGPASDLRALSDAGLHPIGVDLSFGALTEARMLLPRLGLVRAAYDDLPFQEGAFEGLWMSAAFDHLPRGDWEPVFTSLMHYVASGPVYFSCLAGESDLAEEQDEFLEATVFRSRATPEEVGKLLASHGVEDLTVELRPDPIHDRRRPWVVALGRLQQ